jgi:hypothetical protein
MRPAVVHGGDLDVQLPSAAVQVLVLDAHVREVHLIIEVRQVVRPRPGFDLDRVSVRPSVALAAVPIAFLEEALILPLQLVVEDDALDAGIGCVQPLSGFEKGVIDLRVVLKLARLPDARVRRPGAARGRRRGDALRGDPGHSQ